MHGLPCSDSSSLAGEPLAGSAVGQTWRWLGLEYRPKWASKAVEGAELSAPVRAWVTRFLGEPGARVQLIRRSERSGPLAVYLADTRAGVVRHLEIASYDDLLEADLDAAPRFTGPLVWVCTHGQRDVCCARHGGKVFAALRETLGDAVWQTSHLGGHRFAATLLWLPVGICYGRLRGPDVPALIAAHRRDELYRLDTVRGRVAWSRAAQAAEIGLRQTLGEHRLGAVVLVSESEGEVVLGVGGYEHRVDVAEELLDALVIPSCGKAPQPTSALVPRVPPR